MSKKPRSLGESLPVRSFLPLSFLGSCVLLSSAAKQSHANTFEKAVRANRLKLLNEIRAATLAVADFSKIEG